MTKISAEDVVALMDADWHWKPEHRALVRALEKVRVAAEVRKMAGHSAGCDIRNEAKRRAQDVYCTCGQTELKAALAECAWRMKGTP